MQPKIPSTMPPHSMPAQPYPMPRPKMDHMCATMGPQGPRAYSVMAPSGGPGGVKHPHFYLLSTNRPMPAQARNVNMGGGKPMMGQNKILVSTGQPPVKMQHSQHIGFMPVCAISHLTPHIPVSGVTRWYLQGYMVNNNEDMVQQMKRPPYRPQQPGNHNNMIPLNMVPKPYIQNVSILQVLTSLLTVLTSLLTMLTRTSCRAAPTTWALFVAVCRRASGLSTLEDYRPKSSRTIPD